MLPLLIDNVPEPIVYSSNIYRRRIIARAHPIYTFVKGSGIAILRWLKNQIHESVFSLSTTAHANGRFLPFIIANKRVCWDRDLRKVPSTARNLRIWINDWRDSYGQINTRWNMSLSPSCKSRWIFGCLARRSARFAGTVVPDPLFYHWSNRILLFVQPGR